MMKVLGKVAAKAGKGVRRAGKGYNNMGHMDKIFSWVPSFKQYLCTSIANLGLMMFFQEIIYLE